MARSKSQGVTEGVPQVQTGKTPPHAKTPVGTEAQLIYAIKEALSYCGFRVLACGQGIARSSGSTPGVPDLLVANPNNMNRSYRRWTGMLLGLEVKTVTGRLSPAQQELYEAGMIVVVRDPESALRESALRLGWPGKVRPVGWEV